VLTNRPHIALGAVIRAATKWLSYRTPQPITQL